MHLQLFCVIVLQCTRLVHGDNFNNHHNGQSIHISRNSPFYPIRNAQPAIYKPEDITTSESAHRPHVEKPEPKWLVNNHRHHGTKTDRDLTFERSQSFFHESKTRHTDSLKSTGSYLDRHVNERIEPTRLNEEEFNKHFTSNLNFNKDKSTGNYFNSNPIGVHGNKNQFVDYEYVQNRPDIDRMDNTQRGIDIQQILADLKLNEFKLNASQLDQESGVIKIGDFKFGTKPSTYQYGNYKIENTPITKISRTFYINGVKVDDNNNENISSIITDFLNHGYTNVNPNNGQDSHQFNSNKPEKNRKIEYNGFEDENRETIPRNINYLSNNKQSVHKQDLDAQDSNKRNNHFISRNTAEKEDNTYDYRPLIDVRIGDWESKVVNEKLQKLRQKGLFMKNATAIPETGGRRDKKQSIGAEYIQGNSNDGNIQPGIIKQSERVLFREQKNVEVLSRKRQRNGSHKDRLIFQ